MITYDNWLFIFKSDSIKLNHINQHFLILVYLFTSFYYYPFFVSLVIFTDFCKKSSLPVFSPLSLSFNLFKVLFIKAFSFCSYAHTFL